MALSLRNPQLEHLARKVAQRSGYNITETIQHALEAMDQTLNGQSKSLRQRLQTIARDCADLPDLDTRPEDQILGYDAQGLPGHGN